MRLVLILLLLGSGSALAEVQTRSVQYHKRVRGFLAHPPKVENAPAVVLIHEWWGLNDNIRDFARRFAKQGYVALAVDLYKGKVTKDPEEARKWSGRVRKDMKEAFENLNNAVTFLKRFEGVSESRLAAVGWCFGGGWSYQMARNDLGVKGSVIYYGFFNPRDDLKKMRADILGHFGEKDTAIKVDTVKAFEARLKTHSGNHEIFIYENAGHAFANPTNPNYEPKSARAAWTRTMDFLKRVLQ